MVAQDAPHNALPRWLIVVVAAALLALFAGLSLWEMVGDSLTSDELVHLPSGYAYWKKQEFRLNPEHPPLVKLLCSLPLLGMNLRMPSTEPDPGLDYNQYQMVFGKKFFFTQDADHILFWSRLPTLGLGLLLAFLVFWWSYRLHGHAGAGLLSLFLLAFEPTILAHSHYVTMDVPLACFSVMAMFFLWEFSRRAKPRHLVLASLGMALALASKFSAVSLLPVFFLLLFVRFQAGSLEMSLFGGQNGLFKTRILVCAAVAVGIALIVQAFYFLSPDLTLYFRGVRQVNVNHNPNFLYYAAGKFSLGGVWWYPIYAFAVKTPLPTIIAIVVAGISWLNVSRQVRRQLVFVLLPAGILTMATCAFADNLGLRYMIPVTSFLLVLAGRCWQVITAKGGPMIWAGLLALWLCVSVLHLSPHHISYFNELIGGPGNAPHYLDDSNIDWGQDLKRLVQYLKENDATDVILSFWGPAPPEYYGDPQGIRFTPWTRALARDTSPPPGLYALSVNNLVGAKRLIALGEDPMLDWLRRFEPVARVGYSIYIYRFPEGAR